MRVEDLELMVRALEPFARYAASERRSDPRNVILDVTWGGADGSYGTAKILVKDMRRAVRARTAALRLIEELRADIRSEQIAAIKQAAQRGLAEHTDVYALQEVLVLCDPDAARAALVGARTRMEKE